MHIIMMWIIEIGDEKLGENKGYLTGNTGMI
ncbi:MAG: hypothetical protein PWQ15_306 [Methanobacterium sp.]|jgi:hypothetical protein|nr:hypothetical protein [Methanobacterium sp.]